MFTLGGRQQSLPANSAKNDLSNHGRVRQSLAADVCSLGHTGTGPPGQPRSFGGPGVAESPVFEASGITEGQAKGVARAGSLDIQGSSLHR